MRLHKLALFGVATTIMLSSCSLFVKYDEVDQGTFYKYVNGAKLSQKDYESVTIKGKVYDNDEQSKIIIDESINFTLKTSDENGADSLSPAEQVALLSVVFLDLHIAAPTSTEEEPITFYRGSDEGYKMTTADGNYVIWNKYLAPTRVYTVGENSKIDLKVSYKY